MKFKDKITKETFLLSILYLGIFVFLLRHLQGLNTPWVYDDEIGYWGSAAFMAGKDWSGILKYCQYYSFGYSLLLVPLFWLNISPILMYKIAIVINALLVLIALFLANKIVKILTYKKSKPFYYIGLSIISVLNANLILQTQIAWSETLLNVLVWGIMYCFLNFINSHKKMYFIMTNLLTVYLYMVHQRMLGVLIVVVLCWIGYFLFAKRTNIIKRKNIVKKVAFVIFIIVGGLIIASILKDFLQNEVWMVGQNESVISSRNVNDYTGQIAKINEIFSSFENFYEFCIQALGKLFYFGRSTFLLIYVSLFVWVKNLILLIKKKNVIVSEFFFQTIVSLSFLAMFAITSISMYDSGRNDGLIYGRYAEPLTGPLILCGLLAITNLKKRDLLIIPFSYVFEILLGILVKREIWDMEIPLFSLNIVSMGRYLVENEIYLTKFAIELLIMVGCIVCLAIFQKNRKYCLIIVSLVCLLVASKDAEMIYKRDIEPWQKQKEAVISLTQQVVSKEDNLMYYILSDDFNQNGNKNTIQFLYPDKKIICIPRGENIVPEKDALIFSSAKDTDIEKIKIQYKTIKENKEIVVLKNLKE